VSYFFEVVHEEGKPPEMVIPEGVDWSNVPVGVFTVSGHVPAPGMSTVASLGVQLTRRSTNEVGHTVVDLVASMTASYVISED